MLRSKASQLGDGEEREREEEGKDGVVGTPLFCSRVGLAVAW